MTRYEKYQKLRAEYQKKIGKIHTNKPESYFGQLGLEVDNLEVELWVLLTEMSQEDIVKLSQQDQKWREYFINVRKNEYFFQQFTKMRDPNYEQPSLIQGGFFHPDIAKQLIHNWGGIPPLPKGAVRVLFKPCPHCEKMFEMNDDEMQNYNDHILEHHPDTEAAERLISDLKTIDSKPVVSESLTPQPIKPSKLTCPTCDMVFEYNSLATVCPNCLSKLE